MTSPAPTDLETLRMKLTYGEMRFLMCVLHLSPLRLADRQEDRIRQKCRKLGLVQVLKNPRRWALTPLGIQVLGEKVPTP